MTKKSKVVNHLKKGKRLSWMQAFNLYKVGDLRQMIYKLRAEGFPIGSVIKDNYAVYFWTGGEE